VFVVQFNWQYFYWFLTDEGIQYLRGFLHLPDDIVPNTLKKARGGEERERDSRPERSERGPRRFDPERKKKEKFWKLFSSSRFFFFFFFFFGLAEREEIVARAESVAKEAADAEDLAENVVTEKVCKKMC
jgi:hypothetical protein